jgi:hypothetical protein
MARKITISLSDALEARLQAEAEARGSQTLEDCAAAILDEDLEELQRLRMHDEAFKSELRKGIPGPGQPWTEADRERDKQALIARHSRSKAG